MTKGISRFRWDVTIGMNSDWLCSRSATLTWPRESRNYVRILLPLPRHQHPLRQRISDSDIFFAFTLLLDIRKLQKIPSLDLCLYPYNNLPFLSCGSLVPHGIGRGRRAENRAATTWNVIRRLCFLCDTKREPRGPSFFPPCCISLRLDCFGVLIGSLIIKHQQPIVSGYRGTTIILLFPPFLLLSFLFFLRPVMTCVVDQVLFSDRKCHSLVASRFVPLDM